MSPTVCVCVNRFHPSIQSFENMFIPVWVYKHHTPLSSPQLTSIDTHCSHFEFSKAANPWEHTCPCKPQTYRCLISKDSSPPLFRSLIPFPSLIFSLPHYGCNANPPPHTHTQLEAHWNTFPWPCLHFKVDFHPRARPEGHGPTSKWSGPWVVRTSKPVTFSYELPEHWRTLEKKKQVIDAVIFPP